MSRKVFELFQCGMSVVEDSQQKKECNSRFCNASAGVAARTTRKRNATLQPCVGIAQPNGSNFLQLLSLAIKRTLVRLFCRLAVVVPTATTVVRTREDDKIVCCSKTCIKIWNENTCKPICIDLISSMLMQTMLNRVRESVSDRERESNLMISAKWEWLIHFTECDKGDTLYTICDYG